MITEECSVLIDRPIDEVFAFVADQTNAPRWQQGLLEVRRTTQGGPGIGAKHTLVRKFLGQRLEASNEYVEYVPNQKIAFKSTSGPIDFEALYLTESTLEGTKLTSRIEMRPGRFINLAERQISASLRRDMEANLGELKDLLESRAVVSGG